MTCVADAGVEAGPLQPSCSAQGWYLYGFVRRRDAANLPTDLGLSFDGCDRVLLVDCGEIAAVASPVEPARMGPDALQRRLRDATWVEAAVRRHQGAIELVHSACTILPSKFGVVYNNQVALSLAVNASEDKLLAALARLDECDEWGVRLYADSKAVEDTVAAEDALVQHLRRQLGEAKPGVAFFLRRKMDDSLRSRTQQALTDLAKAGYSDLSRHAVATELGESRNTINEGTKIEVLHASFLVRRSDRTSFLRHIQLWLDSHDGIWCQYSGPWAPYSFATVDQENAVENSRGS